MFVLTSEVNARFLFPIGARWREPANHYKDIVLLLQPEALFFPHRSVNRILGNKLYVIAFFYDLSVSHDQNSISMGDGTQPVCGNNTYGLIEIFLMKYC